MTESEVCYLWVDPMVDLYTLFIRYEIFKNFRDNSNSVAGQCQQSIWRDCPGQSGTSGGYALCLHLPEVVERSSVEYPNILFSGTCSTKIMCKVSHVQHKGQQRSTCLTVDAEVTLCMTHGQLYSDLRRCKI